MAYIEFHQALIDHRKTIIAAEILDMQEVHLCGHLAALWCWCLDNCQDGILPESHRVIARGARYTEDPSKFIEALVTAGFVTKTESGLAIHDWSNYGGKLIEKRRTNAEKQARYRDRQDQENKPEGDVTATLPSRNALEKSREEKRRVLPPISPKGDQYSDEFENDFWAHYPKGRGSKQAAFKLWEKLTAEEKAEARDALPKFKAGSDWQRKFHSAPEVWIRGRMWENPPAEEPATARPDGMPPEIARLPWNNAQRVVWEHNNRAQAS